MPRIFDRIKAFFVLVFHRRRSGPIAVPKATNRRADVEENHQWYFKRDILEQLDEYMFCVDRMRKTDPEGYRLFSKIGVALLPRQGMTEFDAVGPRWKDPKLMPGFGGIAILGEPIKEDWLGFKIGYFRMITKPPLDVEPAQKGETVFHVVGFHTKMDSNTKWNKISTDFFIAINRRRKIRPLLRVFSQNQDIKHRDQRKRGAKTTLVRRGWSYGAYLEDNDQKEPPHIRASRIFSILVNQYESASGALRVSCTKGKNTAMFGVDLLRTPYFFDDRDVTLNERGSKRRIFHIVRTHKRIRNGVEGFVKSHFRGERKFYWKGYKCVISMPGKHHTDLMDANIGLHVFDGDEAMPDGMTTTGRFAKRLADSLEQ
jgi:hypothetical protein